MIAVTASSAIDRWRHRRGVLADSILAPPSRLTNSECADRYRVLSADLGEPGPWRTSRVPYLREPMDAITDPRVREVVVMKSARIGATQGLVLNTALYYMHQEPSPIIIALPTDGDAKKFSKMLLAPMIADSPVLRERVSDSSRDAANTILQKSYPGGTLQIVGTTSPRNMRMVHGRVILMSEVDSYNASAGGEGDPIVLLKKRADSYGSPKFVLESTPLEKGTSRIEQAFRLSDQRRYHVACPQCGALQVFKWGGRNESFGIKWAHRQPKTAIYLCEANACEILETQKYRMIQPDAGARWIAGNPESEIPGFHLNALVSPFDGARWSVLVGQWLDAQGKPEMLRGFFNTVLGETFEVEGDSLDADSLMARLEPYPLAEDGAELVPAGVGLLVRTVDTQDDRLETAVWGFGAKEEAWRIDFEMIPGSTSVPLGAANSPWNELKGRIRQQYRHESGATLTPLVTFVDSGGHATPAVYTFTKAMQHLNVYAIKGANIEGAPLLSKPSRSNSANAVLYMVGSFGAKDMTLRRFSRIKEPGPGYIHLPDSMDGQQVSQFTNEKLVTRFVGGMPKRAWVKSGPCEQFHLLAYAYAALERLGPAVKRQLDAVVRRVAARGARVLAGPAPEPTTDALTEQDVPAPRAPAKRAWMPRSGGGFVKRPLGR